MAKVWFAGWLKIKIDNFYFWQKTCILNITPLTQSFCFSRKRKEGGNEEGKIALSADFSAQLISFERQRRVFHQ